MWNIVKESRSTSWVTTVTNSGLDLNIAQGKCTGTSIMDMRAFKVISPKDR